MAPAPPPRSVGVTRVKLDYLVVKSHLPPLSAVPRQRLAFRRLVAVARSRTMRNTASSNFAQSFPKPTKQKKLQRGRRFSRPTWRRFKLTMPNTNPACTLGTWEWTSSQTGPKRSSEESGQLSIIHHLSKHPAHCNWPAPSPDLKAWIGAAKVSSLRWKTKACCMVCSSFIWFLKSDPDPAQSSITQQNDVDVDAHCSPTLIAVVSCSASSHAATFKQKDEKGHFGLVPWPEHSNSFDNESPRVTRWMTPWWCFCVRKGLIFLSKRHLRPHLSTNPSWGLGLAKRNHT